MTRMSPPPDPISTFRFAPDADHQRALRDAFGRFGTGVTVITARGSDGPVGMTANSFSSISLDPPLILWSPALKSRRYDAFADAAHFCVHVLSRDQVALARHFAERGDPFDKTEWSCDDRDVPVLPDCLAVFHCATDAVHPAGDHALILGRVWHVQVRSDRTPGLLFERSAFGEFRALPGSDDQ